MNTQLCLRFEGRRGGYRQAGEPIRTHEYDVGAIPRETAKAFVLEHHYSRTFPAGVRNYGLLHREQLVGVAVFSVPMHPAVLAPFRQDDALELGRFVLRLEVPGNGESWFLGRAFELLRRDGLAGVASFSDPEPLDTVDGQVVFRGHVGTIYQAHNGCYTGRSRAQVRHVLPDGRLFSGRTISKIRNGEQGWRGGAAVLAALGAGDPPEDADDRRSWLSAALERFTRRRPHPGNHKYLWAVNRRARRLLPESLPYPRLT
jgi:hypothetical protein